MEHHGARRVPLGVLYLALALLVAWAGAYRIAASLDLGGILVHPEAIASPPFLIGWPDGRIVFLAPDIAERADPALAKGDRIDSIDGRPVESPADVIVAVKAAGPEGTLRVQAARTGHDGRTSTITTDVHLRSVAQGERERSNRLLTAVLGVFLPWVCLLIGAWVALVRPRDPMGWLVLSLLLAFGQVGGVQPWMYLGWAPWLRLPAAIYVSFFSSTWPIWLALFGVHFAGRLDWERRRPWITPLVLAPFTALVAVGLAVDVGEAMNARALAPIAIAMRGWGSVGLPAAMLPIFYFFLVLGWKKGRTQEPDARRRLRLLFYGASAALTPLLAVVVAVLAVGGTLQTLSPWFYVPCLLAVVVFPLTLAYVIVVERAMDVRVVVRQGLQYTATRGAIRMLVFCAMLAVLWNTWRLINDPTANRPRKLQAITLGMVAALVVPRVARRGFLWTDRRFFREAYDVERMLTDLSDEVRTIVETGPLLETVLDRIGATLHVDRLAAFVHEGERFVPWGARGFASPPASFSAASDLVHRLTETGKPLRVRHDDPDSLLRRDVLAEEDRARLDALGVELAVPLAGKRDLLGFVALGGKKSEEPYSASDAKLLGSVGAQTGLALENARLTAAMASEVARRERMTREIEIARDVQQKLFPQRLPQIPGVDCAGFCRPAQGVGGDYYDFLALPDGRLGIALGDVSGKGIPAALLMAGLQASLRGQRLSGPSDLAQLITNLNRLIYEASPDNRYATFFYGELDPGGRRLDYVNAGHNAPMLFRARGGVERLTASGPVVGLLDGGRYEQRSVALDPGDLLLVYSDGISEAMNLDEEEWGEARLEGAVRGAAVSAAGELIDRLFVAADAFASGAVQYDDMTVVAVRLRP